MATPQIQRIKTASDTTLAYRRLPPLSPTSSPSRPPLVLIMHFRGTLSHWDPQLLSHLRAQRALILLDNAGIGSSTGVVPLDYADWAAHVLDLLLALRETRVDVLGFSMGGCVAQMVALNAARKGVHVRRVVLAGTTASAGPGIRELKGEQELGPFMRLRMAQSEEQQREALLESFFLPGEEGRRAGGEVWERICREREDGRGGLVQYVGQEAARRQAIAFSRFMDEREREKGSFDRLGELKMPVLVANGSKDVLIPTENSFVLWRNLVNSKAHLHLFPQSGHGFLYQYAEDFARLVNVFLDAPEEEKSRL
ncbi:Alpha/Beta hydrolase protein [Phyllosticta citriasiana]|uniref:Alpha/Beta hydrolase protein n=1 Tax=Phyllosticta citriasiana TaxID=595635 RepID=A0ABR1KH34_9PEZI